MFGTSNDRPGRQHMYKIVDIMSWILYILSCMQTVIFMGSSRDDLRAFPEMARRLIGRQILRLQYGLEPEDWKPMKAVGTGVREVRVRAGGQFRAFYVTHVGNAIYILHAFQKKTQRTSPRDIALGQQRFRQIGG